MPIGSIVPKLLAGRNVAKYFKRIVGVGESYMLSEGWEQKIADEMHAADELIEDTMELL